MMKKKYEKPQIAFEDMTLNTAIASCEAYYVTNCTAWNASDDIYDGIPYFSTIMNQILIDAENLQGSGCETGFYCYDIPMQIVLSNKS